MGSRVARITHFIEWLRFERIWEFVRRSRRGNFHAHHLITVAKMMIFDVSLLRRNTFRIVEADRSANHTSTRLAGIVRTLSVVAIVIAFAASARAQQIALSLDSATATTGGAATLTLSDTYTGSTRAVALQWTVTYPTADITSVNGSTNPADTAMGKTIACNGSNGNTVCVLTGLNDTVITAGSIAAMTFQVSPTAPDSTVAIQLSNLVAVAADGTSLSASATGGSISVSRSSTTSLAGLSCSPGSVTSPASSSCTVSLSGTAPTSTVTVGLKSNNTSVTVPASLAIPAGKTSATFNAQIASTSSSQSATLTSTWAGQTRTFALQIAPASSHPALIADGVYRIYSQYSAYVLDDPGFSVSSGRQIIQWPLNGGQNQQWRFTANGSGQFTIQNVFSGLYLTDVNGVLQQTLQNNKSSQLWTLKAVSTGIYTLTNSSTQRLIEDPNFSKSSGTGIVTWAATGRTNENWAIK